MDTAEGLATDHTFGTELDILRAVPGTTLCDLTKLAVDPATKSPALLAGLFHAVFLYGIRTFGCTDVVIEVHPRHVRYYEAMVGFERVGAPKLDASVEWWPSDTPVQLMRLNLRDMRRLIESCRETPQAYSRSLYPYFFDEAEERSIVARIARMTQETSASSNRIAAVRAEDPGYWRAAA